MFLQAYCGYYKHNLENNLVGAELMLEAMGYKHTGRTTMVLDGPVDPDRVSCVSRDSLVALVECQVSPTFLEPFFKPFIISWFGFSKLFNDSTTLNQFKILLKTTLRPTPAP